MFLLILVLLQLSLIFAIYNILDDQYKNQFIIGSIIFCLLEIRLIGTFLDHEAERVVNQLYERHGDIDKNMSNTSYNPYDPEAQQYVYKKQLIAGFGNTQLGKESLKGVIKSAEPVGPIVYNSSGIPTFAKKNNTAIVIIHGFTQSPNIFRDLIAHLEKTYNADIHAPLLKYHGRDLRSFSQMNTENIKSELIKYFSHPHFKSYSKIIIIGHSFGAALVTSLIPHLDHIKLPIKQLILYAPAFYSFLAESYTLNNTQLNLLSIFFRQYFNYAFLGGDWNADRISDVSTFYIFDEADSSLRYNSTNAIRELMNFDINNRNMIAQIPSTYNVDLIMPKNDERINASKIISEFGKLPNVNIHSDEEIDQGTPNLHLKNSKAFYSLIDSIVRPII